MPEPETADTWSPNTRDLMIVIRSLMAFRSEAMGDAGREFCAYPRNGAAREGLTITAEDHGGHGLALRVRLDGPVPVSSPPEPPGRLARCEVKGFRDLGVVRVTETTLGGEPMVHAERTPWSGPDFEGDAADFPASSLHFVTWLSAEHVSRLASARPALAAGSALDDADDPESAPYGYYDDEDESDQPDLT